MPVQYQIGTLPSSEKRTGSVRDENTATRYSTGMVTPRIRRGSRGHLYIAEWMEKRGLSDERLAGRLEVARETVTRYRTQQHRLNPDKIAKIAKALDCEPEELWRPPEQPSLDAIVKGAPEDLWNTAADIVRRLVSKAS